MRTRWLMLVAVCALAALGWTPHATGQTREGVTVQLQAPQRMYLGDNQDIQIVVTGSRNVPPPDLSGLADFEVVYRAPQDMSSTMTTIINGRVSTNVSITYGHLYSITPRRAGTLEIPPITVMVDGKPYTTRGATIEVVQPAQGNGFSLSLTVDHAKAFVGQPILLRLVWTLGKDVAGVQFALPIDGAEHETLPGPMTRPLARNSPGAAVVTLNGAEAMGTFDQQAVTIDRVIVPKQAGRITIGPARADYLTVVGQRQRTMFDSPFESRNITERQFSSAAPIEIEVEDLPADGRPADFSGLVGQYEITASADATSVSVGEPINLMVGVAGPYPPSLVPALDFSAQKSLNTHFRVARDPVLPQTTATAAIFNTMIRARSDSVTAIDPVTINYFDPVARRYRTASTPAIPLAVKASTTVGLPDEPEAAEPEPPATRARPGGLPDIDRRPIAGDGGGALGKSVRNVLRSTTTIGLLVAPPLICGLVAAGMGVARWRRRDPERARRAAAVRRLRRSLRPRDRSIDPTDAAARALANFAADWFSHPADTLTGPAAARLLEANDTQAGRTIAGLIRECDAARFGGVRATERPDIHTIADRALGAARAFGRELRWASRGRAA